MSSKLTALTDLPVPVGADLVYVVDDVAGTPTEKKSTITNLTKGLAVATLTAAGIIEIATPTEVNTGTDDTRAVSPVGLTVWTGDTALVTVGALDAGSITSNFGSIDVGASAITTTGAVGTGTITLVAGSTLQFGAITALVDNPSGTMTLSNIDALDATTEATIEAAIDTLANLTAAAALVTVGALNAGSITSGFGSIDVGASAITTTGVVGTGTLTLVAGSTLQFGAITALVDSPAGTMTLSNIDALDATTESTIEAAIDTLANLTSAAALVTVGALNAGSITSGFGSIDIGASALTTTGAAALGTTTVTVDDATTAGVTTVATLTHTTSGTPANGIGVGQDFVVETAAGNNEIGAQIEAVTTDVTGGSEDFDLVINLMVAGAAAAEVARFTNTPQLTATDGMELGGSNANGIISKTNVVGLLAGSALCEFENSGTFSTTILTLGRNRFANLQTKGDVFLLSDAADTLAQRNGDATQTSNLYSDFASATDFQRNAKTSVESAETLTAGATVTATNLIPANAFVTGITTRVDTAIGTGNGTTGYTVGTSGDPDLWGSVSATAVGTSTDNNDITSTTGALGHLAITAQDVVLTALTGNFDGSGVIKITVHYEIAEAD